MRFAERVYRIENDDELNLSRKKMNVHQLNDLTIYNKGLN